MMTMPFSVHDSKFLPHLQCQLDLELAKGKVNVLSGENGIGKSTLLKALVKKYGTQHRIVLAEQVPLEFFFDRTVKRFRDVLLSSTNEMDLNLFNEFWSLSGLQEKENRLLSKLSGGESQILKLICICSLNADIYLLDEPGQYLDPEKKKLADKLIKVLAQKNKTILIVEHHPEWLSERDRNFRLFVDAEILKGRVE